MHTSWYAEASANSRQLPSMAVFILGDSRTGTLTLHRFLQVLGLRSIHYYMKEADQIEPSHEHLEENWRRLKSFIDGSDYDAYSDYPTRSFYRELIADYPDSHFILTTRRDRDTWFRSMRDFYEKFSIQLDIEALAVLYLKLNDEIRTLAKQSQVRFLEICIDDDGDENSRRIKDFLEVQSMAQLGWENQSDSYRNEIWSRRNTLYSPSGSDPVEYVQAICYPHKAILSEYGWVYLANDSNRFLEYQFDRLRWPNESSKKTCNTLMERHDQLKSRGISYLKFVVPEKSTVYPEYLPRAFESLAQSVDRPAVTLTKCDLPFFTYLAEYLTDLKSYGLLYFRGDSHVNWLGAYFIYVRIVEVMQRHLTSAAALPPVSLRELVQDIAGYDGDLAVQLPREHQELLNTVWGRIQCGGQYETLIRYQLPPDKKRARLEAVPQEYKDVFGERPLLIFENSDSNLPRAVVFRDSTADFLVEFLSEHFSRCVFIWHKGLVYDDVIERERPDIVIHIMAERFIIQCQDAPVFCRALSPSPLPP